MFDEILRTNRQTNWTVNTTFLAVIITAAVTEENWKDAYLQSTFISISLPDWFICMLVLMSEVGLDHTGGVISLSQLVMYSRCVATEWSLQDQASVNRKTTYV